VAAARFWLVGICALGPVAIARFDMVPAVLVVTAVAALGGPAGNRDGDGGRWGRAGFAVGLGTAVKVWPVLLVVALGAPGAGRRPSASGPGSRPDPRTDRAARFGLARLAIGIAAALALVAGVVSAAGWWRDAFGFVGAQQARGLQVEAVGAAPFVLAHMAGLHAGPSYAWGSLQFGSELAQRVATACSLLEGVVVVAAAVRWWVPPLRRRVPVFSRGPARSQAADGSHLAARESPPVAGAADRMLALLLVVLVTSRVLSPQYLVWVLAVAACRPLPSGPPSPPEHGVVGLRRRITINLLVTCLLTVAVYPVRYEDVIQGRMAASLLLVIRNGLLLVICWDAVRVAWQPWSGPRRS
jgi:hypothetical protein